MPAPNLSQIPSQLETKRTLQYHNTTDNLFYSSATVKYLIHKIFSIFNFLKSDFVAGQFPSFIVSNWCLNTTFVSVQFSSFMWEYEGRLFKSLFPFETIAGPPAAGFSFVLYWRHSIRPKKLIDFIDWTEMKSPASSSSTVVWWLHKLPDKQMSGCWIYPIDCTLRLW